MRFGPNLGIFNSLELLLLFLQVKNAVLSHDLINVILLIFDVVVSSTIRLECAFHVLMDSILGVKSILGELLSIMILSVLALFHHVSFNSKSVRFFFIHIVYEVLFAL